MQIGATKPPTTEGWEALHASASYLLANPLFDGEERGRKLELAELVRDLISKAAMGGEVRGRLETIVRALCGPRSSLALPFHTKQLEDWVAACDERTLREAVACFAPSDGDALSRFARFIEIVARPPQRQLPKFLLGSLLNFGREPHLLPIVRLGPFELLEGRLGYRQPEDGSFAGRYASHVAFARGVENRLRESGVGVRDMLDVQAIILRNSDRPEQRAEGYVWAPKPQPEHARRSPRPRPRAADGGAPYLAVSACVGHEHLYLLEWVEFHRLVGVERFFLYLNKDRDAQRELLAPYVDDGTVVVYDWPLVPPQIRAANHCVAQQGDAQWIAFIDIDEFLFSPTGRPLPEVLVDYEGWPGVGVNVVTFGPSGHRARPSGLVIENYLRRLVAHTRKPVKSIVDPARVSSCLSPHYFAYDCGEAVDENHYPINDGATAYESTERLQLNHYLTRSEEELRVKQSTMRAATGGVRASLDFEQILWDEEHCGVDDTRLLRYVSEVKRALRAGGRVD